MAHRWQFGWIPNAKRHKSNTMRTHIKMEQLPYIWERGWIQKCKAAQIQSNDKAYTNTFPAIL